MVKEFQQASSDKRRRAVVYGASGHTGQFVVVELQRRGWAVIACGRDAQKLHAQFQEAPNLEIRTASIEDPDSLVAAFSGAFAVINCAGPFLDTAEPVIRAALRQRIHYLDMSAEQRATLAAFEQLSEAARDTGTVVLPSMAFFGGLGDLLATAAMGDWSSADEIRIAVGLDGWHPTRGTRLTGERNNYRRSVLRDHRLEVLADPPPRESWQYSTMFGKQEVVGFPLAETILISRHLDVSDVQAFINLAPLNDLHNANTPGPTTVDKSGRSAQQFVMDVAVTRSGEVRRASVSGRDIYAISAPLVAEALERLAAIPSPPAGTKTPGQLFDARDFLQALTSCGLVVEFSQQLRPAERDA